MNSCKKCSLSACSCLAAVVAIIVGVAVGALFFFSLLPFIQTIVASIVLELGVWAIAFILVAQILSSLYLPNPLRDCLCSGIGCLLAGAFGSVILAIIALSVVLTPYSIISAVIVGLGALFFTLLIISLISFIRCVLCKMCMRD
jgi:hypothetical protein